jgi:hypothetical protein
MDDLPAGGSDGEIIDDSDEDGKMDEGDYMHIHIEQEVLVRSLNST